MLELITKYVVKPFKAFPYFGRFRFWCLYWAYRITGWHIRHKEWDFVLEYLPRLGDWQIVRVLDVGCSRNLFCHEVKARGYYLFGVDLEKPNFKFPARFKIHDIREPVGEGYFHFVTCISVFEHIEDDQPKALLNMVDSLKISGRLLLTIPTKEFAQGHPWSGFSYTDIELMLPVNAMIREYTEKAGQLCLAIERIG